MFVCALLESNPLRPSARALKDPVLHQRSGATLILVPTARPRHTVTETDDVARALADAARRWPEDRRRPGRLLIRLIHEGHRAVRAETAGETRRRREVIERTQGVFTGMYGPNYLEELREDWPE